MIKGTYTLEELLDMLIGDTDIWCETHHDEKSENNLVNLGNACDYLITKLLDNYKYINRVEASAKNIAIKSKHIIENIYYQIEDVIESENNAKD